MTLTSEVQEAGGQRTIHRTGGRAGLGREVMGSADPKAAWHHPPKALKSSQEETLWEAISSPSEEGPMPLLSPWEEKQVGMRLQDSDQAIAGLTDNNMVPGKEYGKQKHEFLSQRGARFLLSTFKKCLLDSLQPSQNNECVNFKFYNLYG